MPTVNEDLWDANELFDRPVKAACELCSSLIEMGPRLFEGRYVARYDVIACNRCWEGNVDGWQQGHESLLLNHLLRAQLQIPERNERGLWPRE